MPINSHNNLPDSQLHNPKGFATAENDTVLSKDANGKLAWHSPIFESRMFLRVNGTMGGKTATNMYAPNYGGNTQHSWDNVFNQNSTGEEELNQTMMYFSSSGYIKSFKGIMSATGNRQLHVKILTGTPVSGSGSGISWTERGTHTITGSGTTTPITLEMANLGTSVAFASGDMLAVVLQPQSSSSTAGRLNMTMELVFFD
jgi:hypothetical protein